MPLTVTVVTVSRHRLEMLLIDIVTNLSPGQPPGPRGPSLTGTDVNARPQAQLEVNRLQAVIRVTAASISAQDRRARKSLSVPTGWHRDGQPQCEPY